jgi:hypothetical protein
VPIKIGTLRFTRGEPAYYQSSTYGKRGFCAACGSQLVWVPARSMDDSGTNVAVCALDNPADVRPRYHTYADIKLCHGSTLPMSFPHSRSRNRLSNSSAGRLTSGR